MNITERNITDIKPYDNNPRNNDAAVTPVMNSIREFGFKVPIVIDKDGIIIAGHTRYRAALELKLKKVPCVVAEDLTDQQVKAFRLADNKVSEFAAWDMSKLNIELEGIYDLEMDAFGFDMDIPSPGDDDDDLSDEDEEVKPVITQPGDVWILGDHKLVCGDSTLIETANAIMGEEQADMVFTDPPYNVAYEGKTADRLTIENDDMSDEEFDSFLFNVFSVIHEKLKAGGAYYICHADSYGESFRKNVRLSGLLLKQCLVWIKNVFVMGRQDYQWKHEPILYGWKPGASHNFYGGRNKSTVIDDAKLLEAVPVDGGYMISFTNDLDTITIKVPSFEVESVTSTSEDTIWRIDKPSRNAEHPTMKPIALCERGIINSSKPGDIVFEPFGGSGSTLIACENLKRKCRCIELDPRFCDVIVERYIKHTGNENVTCIRGGMDFSYTELKAEV